MNINNDEIKIIYYYRNCPLCNKELKYKNKRKHKYANDNNTNCMSCAQKLVVKKTGVDNKLFGRKRPDMVGEKNPAKTTEARKKISESKIGNTNMLGKKHTDESKEKSRISNTGQKRSDETKQKIREATLRQIENGLHSSNPFCKKMKYNDSLLHYQGTYELDFLEKYYSKIKIENGKNFYYYFNNDKKIYISDFYLPELNLIIEIKSNWTYNKNIKQNILKQNCVIDNNYNFLFIIDKKYEELDKLLHIFFS